MDTIDRLLLRPTEAAAAIAVSRSRIYELIATGEIPSIRIGSTLRVPRASLEEWIARQLEARQS